MAMLARLRREAGKARSGRCEDGDGPPSMATQPSRGLRRTGVELEFLPDYLEVLERPPSRVARGFALAIVAICAAVLAWAVLFELDIIASAPGKIVINQRTKTVQAQDQGEVARILVRDGQRVRAGDVLVELNPVTAQAEAKRISLQSAASALEIARLEALLSDDPERAFAPSAEMDEAKIALARQHLLSDHAERADRLRAVAARLVESRAKQLAAERNAEETQSLLANVRRRYEMRRQLGDKELVSKAQVLETERELLERERELSQQRSSLELARAEEETLRREAARQDSEWRRALMARLAEERRKQLDLGQELIKASEQARRQTIAAPEGGVVQQLAVTTLGSVVKAGQDVLVIVPPPEGLEADVTLFNKDVGFVRPGQAVAVKVDSFPYTKFGTIRGEVVHVSQDAVQDEKLGLVYPTKLKLGAQTVAVEGRTVALSAGMTITAEVRTGSRRVIDYLLGPLQAYANEAMRER